ncbi:AI-2E family transporter [Clostridium botulinum]|uniref:Membrane protein n=1 Tax=Clostridium botulinum TaxID=1491 RepID=A0A9Q1UY99_CLOBO|nr:AI-2E family transporter [Clostridium botulinum]AEB75595.1 permease [Clostridium botulinum BKT015925]KEH99546.1 membrane protein [Clostridium botulinum D str. 16868]KEI04323.1 membrane protein [Clostridium botulinum C/D str. Sp77]KLU75275.1 membrane protein [Clostridium botulinum V891]KOA76577.1 membrane protein [Clostridium botulinum]
MWKNKIPYINLIPIFIILALIFKAINNIEILAGSFGVILAILTPFFWAFGIAYILNPIMVYFERKFKFKRNFSILIVFLLLIGFITLTVTIISPAIINNVDQLANNIPTYVRKTQTWFYETITRFNLSNNTTLIQFANKSLSSITATLTASLNSFLNVALTKAIDITSSFLKMIFGFIISVYILKDKEVFQKNIKDFLYSLFKKKSVDSFLIFGCEVNTIFSQYIIGKSIDSLIIGLLCAIGLGILKTPYVLLISLLVGVTNMIPYFGPFIGMIPAVLITLFSSPIKALWVFIFILVLQQFDGWVLGPKILGDKVGVSPFWIILAITVGGGTFGVLGMFLGVPIIAVIKTLLQKFVLNRLNNKNIKNT